MKIKAHILRQKDKIFALQFEQRRILANTCAGAAVACIFNVATRGILFTIFSIVATYSLLRIAVRLTYKSSEEEEK